MAIPSTRQIYLCFTDQETVQLPVELHMVEDSTFMRDLLASQKASTSGHVSDNEYCINESDCEALIPSSDEETSSKHVVGKKAGNSDPTLSGTTDISQQAINMQIVSQLQMLGKCSDAMEQKSCKKVLTLQKSKVKVPNPKLPQTMVTHTPSHPHEGAVLHHMKISADTLDTLNAVSSKFEATTSNPMSTHQKSRQSQM